MKHPRHLSCLLFSLLTLTSLLAQDRSDYNLLWEVSGGDLDESSYLFGSAHINESMAFDFPQALVDAMSKCEIFASEISMDSMDYWIGHDVAQMILSGTKDDTEDKGFSEFLDTDGHPTVVDAYLSKIARTKGLRIEGLEKLAEQIALIDLYDVSLDRNSPEFIEFVAAYSRGNLEELEKLMSVWEDEMDDKLQMKSRNQIQATSFINYARESSTFGVVGAAHLFGDDNVLALLTAQGYSVRKVDYDKPAKNVESLFYQPSGSSWVSTSGKIANYSIDLPNEATITSMNGVGEMIFTSIIEEGIILMSMTFNKGQADTDDLIESMKNNFGGDKALTNELSVDNDSTKYIQYNLPGGKTNGILRISDIGSAFGINIAFVFAKSGMQNPSITRFLDSYKAVKKETKWVQQVDSSISASYYFPADIDFVVKNIEFPKMEERGKIELGYKLYKDPIDKSEYLMKYQHSPRGVLYLNEKEDTKLMLEQYVDIYKGEIVDEEYSNSEAYNTLDAKFVDTLGRSFYTRCITRGNRAFNLLQISPSGKKNNEFFDSFLTVMNVEKPTIPFSLEKLGFSMATPSEAYVSKEGEGLDDTITSYSFIDKKSCGVMMIEVEPLGRYEYLDLSKQALETMRYDLSEVFDSVIVLESYDLNPNVRGLRLVHTKKGASYTQEDLTLYANKHKVSISWMLPNDLYATNYRDTYIKSIVFNTSADNINETTSIKSDLMIQDLGSKDSLIFNYAIDELSTYQDFSEKDVPSLLTLFESDLYDDNESYGAKYQLVVELHPYNQNEVNDAFKRVFLNTQDEALKSRIIESLSKRDSIETGLSLMLELLEKSEEISLSDDAFYTFNDSVLYFENYYSELISLAQDDKYVLPILDIYTSFKYYESPVDFAYEDMKAIFNSELEDYKAEAENNDDVSIDFELMDYLLYSDDVELRSDVASFISSTGDIDGKYRLIYNSYKRHEELDSELLKEVLKDEYYGYWLLETAAKEDMMETITTEHITSERQAEVFAIHYYNYNKDVLINRCTKEKELVDVDLYGAGTMFLMSCVNDETEGVYVGLVGPFNENGVIDQRLDNSVYYSSPSDEAPVTLLSEFDAYYKSQKN